MKPTLLNITKNAAYAEQLAILKHLEQSLADTRAEIALYDAKLSTAKPSSGVQDTVSGVLAMLAGKTPALSGSDGTATQRADAVVKARLIEQAIQEQQATIQSLASTLSGEVANTMHGEHAEAVRAIAAALKALDNALEAEEAIRVRIVTEGYRCLLPFFGINELGRLKDLSLTPIIVHVREASNYVIDYEDSVSGVLDKPATVHLLADVHGVGRASDIVSMDGRRARSLIRLGRAEATTDKLMRAVRAQGFVREVVLA